MPVEPEVLTTAGVAAMFSVDVGTVSRWILDGRLPAGRTPGGRHRIRRDVVERLLNEESTS